eukprot:Rmarinus@m.4578
MGCFGLCRSQTTTRHQISSYGVAFLFFVTLETLALVSLAVCNAAWLVENDEEKHVRYTIVIAFSAVFLCGFAYDAVYQESVFQFLAFLCVSTMLLVRVFWGFYNPNVDRSDTVDDIFWGVLVGACVFQLIHLILGWKVYCGFGWRMYKKVGADPRLIGMYKQYEAFRSLLLVDFHFALSMSVLAVYLNDWVEHSKFIFFLTLCNLSISLVAMFLGLLSVKSENSLGMILFLLLTTISPSFVVFLAIWMLEGNFEEETTYERANFLTMGGFSVMSRVILLILGYHVYMNFDEGLKEQVFDKITFQSSTVARPSRKISSRYFTSGDLY